MELMSLTGSFSRCGKCERSMEVRKPSSAAIEGLRATCTASTAAQCETPEAHSAVNPSSVADVDAATGPRQHDLEVFEIDAEPRVGGEGPGRIEVARVNEGKGTFMQPAHA
eukprot:1385821-Rhodomonas_salina.2